MTFRKKCIYSILNRYYSMLYNILFMFLKGFMGIFFRKCFNDVCGTIQNHVNKTFQPSDLSSLSAGQSIACPIRMSLYIFLLFYIYHLCFTCIDFYDLSAWGGCWFVVYIRRFIYKFLNVCPFDYTAVVVSGKVGP